MPTQTPEEQLQSFLDKYDADIAELATEALVKLRVLIPNSVELVYDNYNALAVGWGPSERTSEAIISLALYPKWVSLFLLQGAGLPDPHELLQGSGNVAKHIRLESAETLDDRRVLELIQLALESAKVKIDGSQPYKLVIKSISDKQRPRRPGK